jgi:RNA-binding protein YhbY
MLTKEQEEELKYLNSKIKAIWHEGERDLEEVLLEFVARDIQRRTGKKVTISKNKK